MADLQDGESIEMRGSETKPCVIAGFLTAAPSTASDASNSTCRIGYDSPVSRCQVGLI